MRQKLNRISKLYFSSILVYSLAVLAFTISPYYQKILSQGTQTILTYLYLIYFIFAPIYYLIFATKYSVNKPYLFFRGIKKILTRSKTEKEEKVAFLFLIVKFFFLPLMTNFFMNNLGNLYDSIKTGHSWYVFILAVLLTTDTLVFSFGYAFEFKSLKNTVKSVEPTIFGWVVAIICYPPFNGWIERYVPWGADNYVVFWNPTASIIFKTIIIFLLVIYVWATLALGPKASNLTNRGIVKKFPYSIIRHPAYISKNLVWWITLIPVMNWKFALGMSFWTTIYFFRGITEENHLKKDPDYLEYCQKVKWKFIPFIY